MVKIILRKNGKYMVMFIIKQNKEYRDKGYNRIINKRIQLYIKNGCIGGLDLEGILIKKLPKNLKYIGGYLDISYTNISELPNVILVRSFLDISYTNISELPNDIIIEGNLMCYDTPLSRKYSKEEIKSKWKIYGKVRY